MLTPEIKSNAITTFQRYARVSGPYMRPHQSRGVRMYKHYFAKFDKPENEREEERDEPTISLPYAFGICESVVANVTEAIQGMKPPIRLAPKKDEEKDLAENVEAFIQQCNERPEHRNAFQLSNRECIITGWKVQKFEYCQQFEKGKRWVKQPKNQIVNEVVQGVKKYINIPLEVETYEWVKEDSEIPKRVGPYSKFPSIFDVFFEPHVRNTDDMNYCIEQERSVPLDYLKSLYYEDSNTGEKLPVYDLSEIEAELKQDHKPGDLKPAMPTELVSDVDHAEEIYRAVMEMTNQDSSAIWGGGDIDRVHLSHVWEKNRYWCIANGKYVICYFENVFDKPRIPYEIVVYTPHNHHAFGIGAIEPVEHMLYMLNDTESLTYQQWVKLTQNMLFYNENAVVSEDDFDSGGMGRIRIKDGYKVSDVAYPVTLNDSTTGMLQHQSNARGIIEWAIGVSDLSPGTSGTKQTHKTATGLLEIEEANDKRYSMTMQNFLSAEMRWEQFIVDMLEQYQFSKTSVLVTNADGTRTSKEMGRDELVPQNGFWYVLEYNPDFGNKTILRNHLNFLYDKMESYEKLRMEKGMPPNMPEANLPETLRMLQKAFGYLDTSRFFFSGSQPLGPDKKFELLIQGIAIEPQLTDDLVGDHSALVAKIMSPEYAKLIQTGAISEQGDKNVRAHIQGLQILAMQAMNQPVAAEQQKTLNATVNPQPGGVNAVA